MNRPLPPTRIQWEALVQHTLLNRHLAVYGLSGAGKSRLFAALFVELVRQRLEHSHAGGVGVIDVSEELYQDLRERLAHLRAYHKNGALLDELVVLIDPPRTDWIKLDLLQLRYGETPQLRAQTLASTIVEVFQDDPTVVNRMIHVMTATFEAMIYLGLSLAHVELFLVDEKWRKEQLKKLKTISLAQWGIDDLQRRTFEATWDYLPRLPKDAFESTINRLRRFIAHPNLRPMLHTTTSTIDFRQMMDEGKIVLVNASFNPLNLGKDGAYMLGGAMVSEFHLAASSRSTGKDYRPFTLICDEYSDYATRVAIDSIKADRKKGLGFVLSSQSPLGMVTDKDLLEQVMELVGTLISFRMNRRKASVLAEEMGRFNVLARKHTMERWQRRPLFEVPLPFGGLAFQFGEYAQRYEQIQFLSADEQDRLFADALAYLPDREFLLLRRHVDQETQHLRAPDTPDIPKTPGLSTALTRQMEASSRLHRSPLLYPRARPIADDPERQPPRTTPPDASAKPEADIPLWGRWP